MQSDFCVVYPDAVFKITWDFCIIFLILFQAIAVPFKISFDEIDETQENEIGFVEIIEFFIECAFILDIIINFNTGYYLKGNLIL